MLPQARRESINRLALTAAGQLPGSSHRVIFCVIPRKGVMDQRIPLPVLLHYKSFLRGENIPSGPCGILWKSEVRHIIQNENHMLKKNSSLYHLQD